IHSIFGRRINAPLALLAANAAREQLDMEIGCVDEEDGILLYSYGNRALPEGILQKVEPDTSSRILEILLPATPLFNMAFRYNSGRALMMGVKNNGRHPLWMQRLRSAEMLEQVVKEKEHPLIRETTRECMQELWDAEGVRELLYDIRSGAVEIREVYTDVPSPMSLPLQWVQEAAVMYEYSPTPRGIHGAVEEELKKQKELLQPDAQELMQVQKREKLPKDMNQLHSLLMTEGDLAAGELDIPADWLDGLAKDGRVMYLEQGLWIAAEQEEEYAEALGEAGLHIVRRMLRYRGAANAEQTAARYGWPVDRAEEILEELCRREEAVKQDDIYYHAVLYRRARVRTLKNRREEVSTCPGEAYAALLLSGIESSAPGEECLRNTLKRYAGAAFPASYWEGIILPRRVKNYREAMLDTFLAEGELFWHMESNGELCFDYQENIDWDTDTSERLEELTEKERIIYEALLKRGASFMQALNNLLSGESPYDTLLSLLEKGLVCADSYIPVRQWLTREKTRNATARQRVNVRIKALNAGRWDVVRNTREQSIEERLESCFDRSMIICRETAAQWGISWQEALSVLRIWEYTGRARRGYFVEGMSGAQFIREKDFMTIVRMLQKPEKKIVWVNAVDPA
ncbi:MAG: DEAD/DEAH box helicase, partial [Lachnospiraceae bacterium]|nr:DEAD/DEAH box helicase [Lachnospiraceae bacterium]